MRRFLAYIVVGLSADAAAGSHRGAQKKAARQIAVRAQSSLSVTRVGNR